jgi:Zn-dependent peptidase ImmA (M78 family)
MNFKSLVELQKALDISRSNLYRKLHYYNMSPEHIRRDGLTDEEFERLKKPLPKQKDEQKTDINFNSLIATKDKQIEDLTRLLDQSQQLELNLQKQMLEKDSKMLQLETSLKKAQTKKGFWRRLFGLE